MLIEKSDSSSGVVRYNTTLMSMKIFFQSYGLGIGLGSTRSSSFLFDLFAQVGILGSLSFFLLYKELVFDLRKRKRNVWIFFFSIVLLMGQILAEPDFSFGFLWMGLFMAACCYKKYYFVDEKIFNTLKSGITWLKYEIRRNRINNIYKNQ